MSDDLQRLKQFRAIPSDTNETEEDDVSGVFGCLRGLKEKALMLELRLKSGNSESFSYALLDRVCYNPTSGITLHFGVNTVHVYGQRLKTEVRPNVNLYEGLLRHRITWIKEAGQAESLASQAPINVTGIEVK
ncbi:MAG: hypothetical protein U0796_02665 [Gemmatales bacterium]